MEILLSLIPSKCLISLNFYLICKILDEAPLPPLWLLKCSGLRIFEKYFICVIHLGPELHSSASNSFHPSVISECLSTLVGGAFFPLYWWIHFTVSLDSDLVRGTAMVASIVSLGAPQISYRSFPQSVPGKEGTENKFHGISFYAPSAKRVKVNASCSWECRWLEPLWKTVWHYLLKLKMEIPYDPEISLVGLKSKKCLHGCTKRCVQDCS